MFKRLSRVTGASVVSANGHLIADTLVMRMGKTSYRRPPAQTEIFSKFETFIAFHFQRFLVNEIESLMLWDFNCSQR